MATSLLLEHERNRVTATAPDGEHYFEIAKKRCRCWFCPECSRIMGYSLRKKLFPILDTFSGLLLLTFTVDPTLFTDPQSAYVYMREHRCIARTIQDLFRWGFLYSRRYFYVVEWQRETEQAHFHVLVDARFIPWDELVRSWAKHRPKDAGPVVGNRPEFGTALISKARFNGGSAHAAGYVTKYLTKTPEHGFPAWVLRLGKTTRIRRYSASRGFWNTTSSKHVNRETTARRKPKQETYAEKIAACGSSVNVFEVWESPDTGIGYVERFRVWVAEIRADADTVIEGLFDPGESGRFARSLFVRSLIDVQQTVSLAAACHTPWIRGGPKYLWN